MTEAIDRVLITEESPQSILVIQFMHFGDVLLMTPVLSNLRRQYPQARLDVLLYAGTEAMLAANPAVDNVYQVDRAWKKAGLKIQMREEWALFRRLKAARYDLIVNLSGRWRAALYCLSLNPGRGIAFNETRNNRCLWRACHTVLVERPPQTGRQHTVLNNLGILTPLRLPTLSTQVTMAYEAGAAAYWQEVRQQRELKDYVVVQPTARWAFKTWSAEGFSQLLDHLSARGQRVVLTGGPAPEEKAMIEAILTGCRYENRVVNLAGRLSLTQLAVFIERAKLFVGVDSAPMHMAAALGTPIVALFGPSNLAQWYPWQTPHTMLWAGRYRALPPVHQVNTATADRYLHAIPASAVIKAVDAWLDDRPRMLREYADNPPRYADWQEWRQADNI